MTYATLLILLLLLMLLSPVMGSFGLGGVFAYLLTPSILLIATFAASDDTGTRRAAVSLVAVVVLTEVMKRLDPTHGWFVANHVASGVFYVYVAAVMARHIMTRDEVTRDVILGSICVYLLMGVCFYEIYSMVELVSPGSFMSGDAPVGDATQDGEPTGRYPALIYFSFVTLTTLGYGDIAPVSPVARSLANMESVIGQLYLTILIAALVGTYLAQNRLPPRDRDA